MEQNNMFFPLFVDLRGKKILVAGAGKIALRRIKTLLMCDFGAEIVIVAPEFCEEIEELEETGKISVIADIYRHEHIEGAFMVLACTDNSDVNMEIVRDCRQQGVPVNNAGDMSCDDFMFPGLTEKDGVLIAFNGAGRNHGKVRQMRQLVEESLNIPKKDR